MDPKTIAAFSTALEQSAGTYGNYKVETITKNDSMKDILPQDKCGPPYYLITRQSSDIANNTNNNATDNQSFVGSPLKLTEYNTSNDAILTPTGELYIPVEINEARKIISQYIAVVRSSVANSAQPMWVLCQPQSRDLTIALGVKIDKAKNLISNYKMQGPIYKGCDLPKLSTLLNPQCFDRKEKMKNECFASYTVLSPLINDLLGIGDPASLSLDAVWMKSNAILQPPSLEALCTVHVHVGLGDVRSGVYSMYNDLSQLLALSHGLIDGQVQWVSKENDVCLLTEVQNLLKDMGASRMQKRSVSVSNNDDDISLSNLYIVERHLDFTEQLWLLLKNCSSYQKLIDALNTVITAIKSGHLQTISRGSVTDKTDSSLQLPIIHPRNSSRLANFISCSFSQSVAAPSLEGLEPLKLLLELGLEKLRRDYCQILIGRDVVIVSALEYFLEANISLLDQADRLTRLHIAVELYVLLHQFLSLPQVTLTASMRKALIQLQQDSTLNFSLSVEASCVSQFFRNLAPDVWSAKGSNGQAVLTMTNPLTQSVCMKPDSENKDVVSHFLTLIRQIECPF